MAAAVVMFAALASAPAAAAAPTSPLCEDGSYRAHHPLICDTGAGNGPPGAVPGGGGGGSGGLLGAIGHLLGGLL